MSVCKNVRLCNRLFDVCKKTKKCGSFAFLMQHRYLAENLPLFWRNDHRKCRSCPVSYNSAKYSVSIATREHCYLLWASFFEIILPICYDNGVWRCRYMNTVNFFDMLNVYEFRLLRTLPLARLALYRM